ncbi:MAG: peptide deformylase [Actinomycetota bacterium]
MPVRNVVTYPHPALKRRASEVDSFTPQVACISQDLVDTMRAHPGCVGLAAPQIDENHRIIVVDVSAHPKSTASHGMLVLVNPVIVTVEGQEIGREGCLSLPKITANVSRGKRIVFEGALPDGTPFRSFTGGFEARALLHEIDHLDGILILDRVSSPSEIFERRQ